MYCWAKDMPLKNCSEEREAGDSFLVEVPNRRRRTLEALIENHILRGSHIMSDGWAVYANIEQI
ncbi:hypothetical protein TCAL_15271, partial [Tigriopus californicus]